MGDVAVKQSLVVKHLLHSDDVAVGVVGVVIYADVAVTGAGEGYEVADG